MKVPVDSYYSRFSHVEVGRYSAGKNTMFRDSVGLIPWSEIRSYAAKYDNVGIYHSIRMYQPGEGIEGSCIAPLHFDIDNKEDVSASITDTIKIYEYLRGEAQIPDKAISIYFSGMKGFHIECNSLAIKVGLVHENLAGVFRHIAKSMDEDINLPSLDYSVYDARRMWRLAGSQHQKTGLHKILCKDLILNNATLEAIQKKAKQAPSLEDLEEPDPEFSPNAAMYFTERVMSYEAEIKEREQNKLENFLKSGSKSSNYDPDALRQFTPDRLKEGCPVVESLIHKAETYHTLDHYERLFLCSLMTYTPEAIEYLQRILSNLDDYNFEISNLHIQDWIMRREHEIGGRPYSCVKAAEVGINCGGCHDLVPKTYETSLGLEHTAEPSPVRFAYKYHS